MAPSPEHFDIDPNSEAAGLDLSEFLSQLPEGLHDKLAAYREARDALKKELRKAKKLGTNDDLPTAERQALMRHYGIIPPTPTYDDNENDA